MANPEHVAKLKEGVKAWNQWRRGPQQSLDSVAIDLSKSDLSRADLREANLFRANLNGANLNHSNLGASKLIGADLIGADLSNAILTWASLIDADLQQANLSGAILGSTVFGSTHLSGAVGLNGCNHVGPSVIDHSTLTRSGSLPREFLQGCGLPNNLIEALPSLLNHGMEFYSCFISHSSQDRAFAERLNADLRAKNLRCWFPSEDLKIGDRFDERIEESIRHFDKVMVVLSENSVKSRWVEREMSAAREREDRENRTVLFPIRLDDAVMEAPQPWVAEIRRSRHIGDFSRWKDQDLYIKAIERLLRDLKAENGALIS